MLRILFILFFTLSASAAEVRVFAAVSLTEALQDIARTYERQSSDRIAYNFGASSLLARQIEEGAPADLFLSADEARMNELAKRGLLVSSTRSSVLANTLVIVVPHQSTLKISAPNHLLRADRIALAEPSSVPAGVYARAWLRKLGLWQRIERHVIPTDNVRAALAAVESGNVDAAIVYKTDARIAQHARIAYEVPRAQGPTISYPFAMLRDADNRAAALRFLEYLHSTTALQIFARHGFLLR